MPLYIARFFFDAAAMSWGLVDALARRQDGSPAHSVNETLLWDAPPEFQLLAAFLRRLTADERAS